MQARPRGGLGYKRILDSINPWCTKCVHIGPWRGHALLQKRWFVPVRKPLLSRFPNRKRQSGTKGGALLSRVWQPGQKRTFCTNRDKRCCQRPRGWRTLLSWLVLPTGTKGAASAHVAGAPFCPGWCYQPGPKVPFFFLFSFSQFFFYFNYTFTFQLNLYIGIQCVWSPLIYTYI